MRFLKPLLAGAALLALAVPAIASADPYHGDRDHDSYRGGYGHERAYEHRDHGYRYGYRVYRPAYHGGEYRWHHHHRHYW